MEPNDRRLHLKTPFWVVDGYAGNSTTHRAACLAAESLRQVNHALGTIAGAEDVYDLVASLASCLERMPQATEFMLDWLRRQHEAGLLDLDDDSGEDVALRLEEVRVTLQAAVRSIQMASAHMRAAHNAVARVRGPLTEAQRAELRGGVSE